MVGKLNHNREIGISLRLLANVEKGISFTQLPKKAEISTNEITRSLSFLEDKKLIKTEQKDGRSKQIKSVSDLISPEFQARLKKLIKIYDKK